MKKEILILIITIILTSGCEINYTLDIDNERLNETTTVKGNPENEDQNFDLSSDILYSEYINKPIPTFNDVIIEAESNEKLEGITYYETKDVSDEIYLGAQFKGVFTLENITNSTLINYAYADFKTNESDDRITLLTGPRFKLFEQYPNLDKVTINIITKSKVLEHNADEVNGNKYTWYINKSNYLNKPITLIMNKSLSNKIKQDIENISDNTNESSKIFIIIFGFITIIVVIIALIILNKSKRNNKI